jgi:outer membrane protein assembly factor BamB
MRRALMVLLLTAVGIGFASCDWPMYRYDTGHTGYDNSESGISVSNVGSLVLKWSFKNTGPNPFGFFSSSPAVVNGVAYIEDAGNGFLDALNATTGALLWQANVSSGGDTDGDSPAVVDGVVYAIGDVPDYLGNGTVGPDNILYAFNAAGSTNCSGTPKVCSPLWQYNLGGVANPVNVVNGVLYVGTNGVQDENAGGNLYALDAASGSLLWSASYGGEFTSSAAVSNSVVYVGTGASFFYAFDANGVTNCSGTPKICSPLWSGLGTGDGTFSPAVANGIVYVESGLDGDLYAYDANGVTHCSGTPKFCHPLWGAATGSYIESAPAIANGVVYVGAQNGQLYAFDSNGATHCSGTPKVCRPLWSATTTSGYLIQSAPMVANGVVYVGSTDRKLYAFNASGTTGCAGTPKTCTPLWTTANTGLQVTDSPAMAYGNIYFANESTLFDYALP